jgi:hypothetical protein
MATGFRKTLLIKSFSHFLQLNQQDREPDWVYKAHGGELKVKSKEDEGTEFVIELPIV